MKRFVLCLLALGMIFSMVPSLGCECGGPESALSVTVSPKEVEPGGEITVTVEVSPPQEVEFWIWIGWLGEDIGPFFTDASGELSGFLDIDPQISAGEYEVTVDIAAGEAHPQDYDAIIIPGGYAPNLMRRNPAMVGLVRDAYHQGKLLNSTVRLTILCPGDNFVLS